MLSTAQQIDPAELRSVALDSGQLDGLRDTGVAATRQLAKRQLTWLRSMHDRERVECDAAAAFESLLDVVRRELRG